jgi:putative nucleotidyltransferase with HDIG domain
MANKSTRRYVAAVCTLAAAMMATEPWHSVIDLSARDRWGLVGLIVLGLLSESLSLRTAAKESEGTFTITLVPLLASVIIFGPGPTVVFMGVSGAVAEFLYHRKPLLKASFNVAQYIVATSLAGLVYRGLGGLSLLDASVPVSRVILSSAVAFVFFGASFLITNHLLVAGAINVSRGKPLRDVLRSLFGRWGSNIAYDMLVSPIALAVAILYKELYVFGLSSALLPLLFIRHSYQLNYRVIKANQDLLRALVKAIETRDPYTSGHSVRVANLAAAIARDMGLKSSEADHVEQAALLHDIGKIDSIYSEILRKPSMLSASERSVIESHVAKGVELLESLSSVPLPVIDYVRYHHERVDGKGYPEGLRDEEIPLGARIIKVCDAIDAMLSDRPYRKALNPETTRRELSRYAGVQFDAEIVRAVLSSNVLERHHQQMATGTFSPNDIKGGTRAIPGHADLAFALRPLATSPESGRTGSSSPIGP